MEENQNGMYGGGAPRTYGEESKMYENQDKQAKSQSYEQANPYSQSYEQANPYSQSYSQPNQQYGYSQQSYSQSTQQYNQPNQQYNQPNQQYGYSNQSYGQSNQQYGSSQQSYNQPNQQYGYSNQSYGQMNQPYGAPTYQQPYMNGLGIHTPVKDIFCNFLLVIMPIRVIVSMITTILTFSAIDSYDSFVNGSYLTKLASGSYSLLSMFSSILFFAYIAFVVLDIVAVNKGNYKILGLVMFALFLNPGYYIWRAHILGRKKTIPIIYTVVYSILMIVNFVVSFYYGFNLGMEMSNSLLY